MNLPCKIVLNQGVIAVAGATNELLEQNPTAFTSKAIRSMIDLDAAWLSAKHLVQSGDEPTMLIIAKFNAEIAARALACAADRVGDLESGKL